MITSTGQLKNDLYFTRRAWSEHAASPMHGYPSTLPITVPDTNLNTLRSHTLITLSPPTISNSTRRTRTQSNHTIHLISLSLNAPVCAPTSTSRSPPPAAKKSKSTRKALTIAWSTLWHHPLLTCSVPQWEFISPTSHRIIQCTQCASRWNTRQSLWNSKWSKLRRPFNW